MPLTPDCAATLAELRVAPEALDICVGATMVVGLIICFFGYRIFKVVLALAGCLVGGLGAAAAASAMSDQQSVVLVAGLVGSLVGSVLAVGLYFVGVFLLGAGAGAGLGVGLCIVMKAEPMADPARLLIAVAFVVGGVVALVLQKLLIILSTSFGGAWSISYGVLHFLGFGLDAGTVEQAARSPQAAASIMQQFVGPPLHAALGGTLLLGVIGVAVQYCWGGGRRPPMAEAV